MIEIDGQIYNEWWEEYTMEDLKLITDDYAKVIYCTPSGKIKICKPENFIEGTEYFD